MKIKGVYMKNKAFTLIELLVVVLILGILAAIALPSYQRSVEKGRASSPIIKLAAIAKAEKVKKLSSLHYTDQVQELDISLIDEQTGSPATGNNFVSELFSYKVYGDDEEAAVATRMGVSDDKKYELSINYATGQIYCRPITNPVCIDLNLDEGPIYGEVPWTSCDGAYNYFRQPYENNEGNYNVCDVKNLKNGDKTFRLCSRVDEDGVCYDARVAKYDEATQRVDILNCYRYNPDGTCSCSWGPCENAWSYSKAFVYDFDNNTVKQYGCFDTKYLDTDGICHKYGSSTTFYYDNNNNIEYQEYCYNLDEGLNCNQIHSVDRFIYDDNHNKIGRQYCNGYYWNPETKTCSQWQQIN